jgi:hypothetical protein
MRSRFDQFVKQMLCKALEPAGDVVTNQEVSPDAQYIDVWFVPRTGQTKRLKPLGLLWRMTARPCALEHFHRTPGASTVAACQRKHADWCHILSAKRPRRAPPLMWVLSSGRPTTALRAFRCQPVRRWPQGVYAAAPILRFRVVAICELPEVRSTMLLRLMGAGRVLRRAIEELKALPANAPEHPLAVSNLRRLRLAIPQEPAKQTKEERDFLMSTDDLMERWDQSLREEGFQQGISTGLQKGLSQGLQKGLAPSRRALVILYETRFGSMPVSLRNRVERAADPKTLSQWCDLMASSTQKDVDRALRRGPKPGLILLRPGNCHKANSSRTRGRVV